MTEKEMNEMSKRAQSREVNNICKRIATNRQRGRTEVAPEGKEGGKKGGKK